MLVEAALPENFIIVIATPGNIVVVVKETTSAPTKVPTAEPTKGPSFVCSFTPQTGFRCISVLGTAGPFTTLAKCTGQCKAPTTPPTQHPAPAPTKKKGNYTGMYLGIFLTCGWLVLIGGYLYDQYHGATCFGFYTHQPTPPAPESSYDNDHRNHNHHHSGSQPVSYGETEKSLVY